MPFSSRKIVAQGLEPTSCLKSGQSSRIQDSVLPVSLFPHPRGVPVASVFSWASVFSQLPTRRDTSGPQLLFMLHLLCPQRLSEVVVTEGFERDFYFLSSDLPGICILVKDRHLTLEVLKTGNQDLLEVEALAFSFFQNKLQVV